MTANSDKPLLARNLARLIPRPYNQWAKKNGFPVGRVYAWIAGEEPDAPTVAEIARLLHISTDELLS